MTMRTHLSAVHLHTIHIINLTTSQMLLHFQHFHLSSHLLSMPWFFSRCLFPSVFNYFLDASVTWTVLNVSDIRVLEMRLKYSESKNL